MKAGQMIFDFSSAVRLTHPNTLSQVPLLCQIFAVRECTQEIRFKKYSWETQGGFFPILHGSGPFTVFKPPIEI